MTESRSVLITGMHRSGTSLVASVLRRAGVDLGSDLLGPAVGNPRGHFEDKEFLSLQQGWLDRADLDILVRDRRQVPKLGAADREAAQTLVAARSEVAASEGKLWGFKDPRSTLFLDLWHGLLPEPRYVVVYRHPLDVALSLDRRGSDLAAVADPRISLRSWCVHNRAALDFVRRHRDRCFVCDVRGAVADLTAFVEQVTERLDLALDTSADFSGLFAPVELHTATDRAGLDDLLADLVPEVAEVHRELIALADLPGPAAGGDERTGESQLPRARRLEQLVEWWTPDLVDDRTRRPFITLLMALLDRQETDSVEAALAKHLDNFASHRRHARNLEQELARSRDEAAGHREGVSRLEAALAEKNADREALATHTMNLEGRLAEQAEDLRSMSAYSARLEEELAEKANISGGLELEMNQTRDYLASIEQHASNLESLVQERLERTVELERHSSNLESELESARARIADLEGHASNLETVQLSELERHSANLESELESARSRISDLEGHASNLETVQLAELKRHNANLESELKSARSRIDDLEKHASQLESERLSGLERHAANLEKELDSARDRIADLEGHVANLEAERERRVSEAEDSQADAADSLAERVEELERHTTNLESELGRSRERASELDRHAANLERLRAELEQRVGELEAHAANLERLVPGPRDPGLDLASSDPAAEPAVE